MRTEDVDCPSYAVCMMISLQDSVRADDCTVLYVVYVLPCSMRVPFVIANGQDDDAFLIGRLFRFVLQCILRVIVNGPTKIVTSIPVVKPWLRESSEGNSGSPPDPAK